MDILTFSEILFNFTFSIVALVIAVALVVLVYHIVKSIISVKIFFNNMKEKSSQMFRNIDTVIMGFASLPIISKLFKKKK